VRNLVRIDLHQPNLGLHPKVLRIPTAYDDRKKPPPSGGGSYLLCTPEEEEPPPSTGYKFFLDEGT